MVEKSKKYAQTTAFAMRLRWTEWEMDESVGGEMLKETEWMKREEEEEKVEKNRRGDRSRWANSFSEASKIKCFHQMSDDVHMNTMYFPTTKTD